MTASRDPDRLIHTFFEEGLDELPDPVYDAVRDRIEQTPQRVGVGPRRTPDVNRYLTIGLTTAGVVIMAVILVNLLPGGLHIGTAPSVSPSVSPSAAEPSVAPATAEPSTPADALGCCAPGDTDPVEPGPFVIWDDVHGGYNVTVTVQSSGWAGAENQHALIYDNNFDPPDGAALLVFQGGDVPPDPCAWLTTTSPDTLETVDGYVAAMTSQASRDASEPVDITVAGHPGKAITLHVPDDSVFSPCDHGLFVTLTLRTFGDPLPHPDRGAWGPGQIDEFWIVNVDGHVVMFDLAYGTATPQGVIDDMRATVESATFGALFQ
jgi:hypothetical protein